MMQETPPTNRYGADRFWPLAEGGGGTVALVTLVAGALAGVWWIRPNLLTALLAGLGLFLWLAVLYFFRDPNRRISAEPGVVLSPGDGQVVAVVEEDETHYLQRRMRRISIFLDVYNVHVQRVPLGGTVVVVERRPGRFIQAFKPEASTVNESIAMVVDSAEYGTYLVKQIAGIVARRCINRMQPGQPVATGQRFGLIRFGSRVDLFLPLSATVRVAPGDPVYGGLTTVATLPPAATAPDAAPYGAPATAVS